MIGIILRIYDNEILLMDENGRKHRVPISNGEKKRLALWDKVEWEERSIRVLKRNRFIDVDRCFPLLRYLNGQRVNLYGFVEGNKINGKSHSIPLSFSLLSKGEALIFSGIVKDGAVHRDKYTRVFVEKE